MPDVFISYAREDLAKARLLAEALGADGVSVWWDHDLVGGESFREKIDASITAAHCVIVLWTEHSVKSPFVKDEASRANDAGKLLPVAIGDVAPPVGFGELQTIRFKRWGETSSEWEVLARAVASRLKAAGITAREAEEKTRFGRQELAFFGRNIDVFLLTMFCQGLACFLLFQPLHFLTSVPLEAKLGLVAVVSLFVSGFQSWVLIAQRSGLVMRAFAFACGLLVGFSAYYFSGATLDQINLMMAADLAPGAGISLFNGFVLFVYIITWGMIGLLVEK